MGSASTNRLDSGSQGPSGTGKPIFRSLHAALSSGDSTSSSGMIDVADLPP